MGNKAWITGASDLLTWYDQASFDRDTPYYSIWKGTKLIFAWNEEDKEKGRAKLERDIGMAEDSGVSEIYTLRLHPAKDKSGFITNKTDYTDSIDFRPAAFTNSIDTVGNPFAAARYAGSQQMQDLTRQLNVIQSDIAALKAETTDPPEIEQNPLIGMLNTPQVQSVLADALGRFLSGIIPERKPGAIAGILDDPQRRAKIDQAIQVLEKYDEQIAEDLLLLAKVAQFDNAQFNTFLLVLRSGKPNG